MRCQTWTSVFLPIDELKSKRVNHNNIQIFSLFYSYGIYRNTFTGQIMTVFFPHMAFSSNWRHTANMSRGVMAEIGLLPIPI